MCALSLTKHDNGHALDGTDRKLLALLQDNAKLSQAELADLFAAASRLTATGLRLLEQTDPSSFSGPRPLAETVAEAIDWYRTAVPPGDLPGLTPPSPKAAA